MTESLLNLIKRARNLQKALKKSSNDEKIGKVIAGKYKILDVLGSGAMATVYKGLDEILDRVVAIKVLHTKESSMHERFAREMRVHAKLKHPNIVEALDCITSDGNTNFVMEYLEGATLQDVLKSNGGPLKAEDLAYIINQITSAFAYAHRQGVVHRDLKPANLVLIEKDDKVQVKIVDFGLAKVHDQMQKITKTGQVVGSPMYMSPEQCMGENLDHLSDLYSLGIITYELATGDVPYKFTSLVKIMHAHANPQVRPTPIYELDLDISLPMRLDKVIMQAIESDKNDRFKTMEQFGKAIGVWYQLVQQGAPDDKEPYKPPTFEKVKEPAPPVKEPGLSEIWQLPEMIATDNSGGFSQLQIKDLQIKQAITGEIICERYEMMEVIGEGGLSVVYKAKNIETGLIAAAKTLKLIHLDVSDRFLREIRIHTTMRHPNIVKALDHFQSESGQVFFIMELLDGVTLQNFLACKESADLATKCSLIGQILDALEYAHDIDVIHRDLKPDNIMVVEQGGAFMAKVLDFGLAKIEDDLQKLTRTGVLLGTPAYMSPEHLNGQPLDKRSDLYSLAILIFQILTGELPYKADSDIGYVEAHCSSKKPISLATLAPELPEVSKLESVLNKALSKVPNERHQSAEELKQELANWWQTTGRADITPFRVVRRRKKRGELETESQQVDKPETVSISGDLDTLVNRYRDDQVQTFAASRKEAFLTPEKLKVLKMAAVAVAIIISGVTLTIAFDFIGREDVKRKQVEEARKLEEKLRPVETPSKVASDTESVDLDKQTTHSVYGEKPSNRSPVIKIQSTSRRQTKTAN